MDIKIKRIQVGISSEKYKKCLKKFVIYDDFRIFEES